ncbi:MAG: bifunctional serine/threonine protein kinase/MFS transporter [Thermoguttaceae bacterium]
MSDAPHDDRALSLLDAYLAELQAGGRPDRAALLREHPELASALDCLDALEVLAPPGDGSPPCGEPSSNAAMNGALPRDFGPYELIREIGRGGMGVVYEARQKDLDRSVAIKMILAGHLASPELVRRFQAEAKAAARLRHSNIVHIHDVGQFQGQDFFTMEYIDGQSLAERVGSVSPQDAVRLVAIVARAVEHLHQQGIIHRDLKPSNILIDAEGQPYVTDFGLAKVFLPGSDATATGIIAGTPSYMAPEQASGRRAAISPATDVYSLGAILYELLTGVPPFRAETPIDTLMEVLSGDPRKPRSINAKIPIGLELICLKCLSKEPSERYASAAALADDLDRFARDEPLAVRPPTVAQRFWSWTRRQPALASRLGALTLFYTIETINYLARVTGVTTQFHARVSIVVVLWAAVSIVCQRLLSDRRWSLSARYVWGTLDTVALLAVLLMGHGATSSLVICYPLIIVGSGLWFRVRYVWFMTVLSLLSYGVTVIDFYYWRPELHGRMYAGIDRHIIFAVGMVVLGAVVSYLVERVRVLSTFYGRPV